MTPAGTILDQPVSFGADTGTIVRVLGTWVSRDGRCSGWICVVHVNGECRRHVRVERATGGALVAVVREARKVAA